MQRVHTRAGFALAISLTLAGCVTRYYARSEAPPEIRAKVARTEQYYLDQAKKKAAFATGCEPAKVTATVLQTSSVHRGIIFEGHQVYSGEVATSIGVDACGSRQVYNVICGVNEHYEAESEVYRTPPPCDLALEGSAAEAASVSTDEQDAEIARQQAAAAAAAAAAKSESE